MRGSILNIRFSPALILLLLLSACDQKTPDAPVPPRQVKIATAEAARPLSTRVFPARILAGDNTEIAFKRAGQLQTLEVREGEAVKQGQILARLTNNDARQRLNDRQSAATLAQRQFERYQTLARRNVVSQAELEVHKASRDSARAALKIAQEELNDLNLTAPFSGVIARLSVRNHQVVAAGQPVATISRSDLLDVIFSVPENLFASLDMRNASYQPRVRINNLPDREFTATYKEHTASSEANSLTWQVTLIMPRPENFPAVAGLSGTVTVNPANLATATPVDTLVIPVEAVFNPDSSQRNDAHVWVIAGEGDTLHVEDRKVSVGELTSQGIEIKAGLQKGDRVVAAGVSELHAQQPVRIWVRERGL
jgi:RND family efflux transporter MFP subunit